MKIHFQDSTFIWRLVCALQLSEELDKVDEKLKAAEDLLESKVSFQPSHGGVVDSSLRYYSDGSGRCP